MSQRVSVDRFVAAECRKDYYTFFQTFWGEVSAEKLIPNWHIRLLCNELQQIAERVFLDREKDHDLAVNCPPGSTKSKVASVLWPAWCWTRMPSARFLCASYAERLALDLARQHRDVVVSEKYQRLFPEVKLRADQNTKGCFMTAQGGWRFTTGVGGSATGVHNHFIVVDDPLDPLGAMSDLTLVEANLWMSETLADRKVDKLLTPTVLIMQRLHQYDCTANMLDKNDRVRWIVLPADDSGDIHPPEWKSYYTDGLFDTVRFPHRVLEDARKRGEEYYAGQYLQMPVPRGGGMFKVDRLRYGRGQPSKWDKGPLRYWDKACLVAGTQVETLTGPRPIEEVRAGDYVLTRNGLREVEWAGETKRVTEIVNVWFSDGSVVSGTPDHLVWTENRGWTPLVAACDSDYNVGVASVMGENQWAAGDQAGSQTLKYKPSMGLITRGGPASVTSKRDDGTKSGSATSTRTSSRPCGGSTREPFPMVTMSTTLTGTQATTTLRILGASLTAIICEDIGSDGVLVEVRAWLTKWWLGLELPKARKRFGETVSNKQPTFQSGRSSASSAVRLTSVKPGTHVPVFALWSANVPTTGSVPVGGIPVFDLTVRDCHEFFANGILVHNSTKGGDGAFSAGVLGAEAADVVWILDAIRGRWDSGFREKMILETARQDGKSVRVGVEQEPGSGGKESAESTVRRLTQKGFRAYMEKPSGDKELRADPLSTRVNLGDVCLLVGQWNKDFVEEMRFFPKSRYKDQIDAASGMYTGLTKKRLRVGTLPGNLR